VARVPLTSAAYLPHLEQAAADVVAVLETGVLDAPVPGCAPWRLTDLAHHLGGVHRWARTAVVDGRPDAKSVEAPTERAALVAWFREGADALLATLRETDPNASSWSFGPPPHTASFWFRRQAHETAVHAGDAAASQGATRAYGTELALDGIDEVVGLFFPRQVRLGRTPPLPTALALEPAEGGRWVLAGDGTGRGRQATASRPTAGRPGGRRAGRLREASDSVPAVVSGPADALLLLLWHRTTLDDPRLAVSGDRAAAEAVLAAALTS
jgi:uncharacterized protein (TIGR03083 family)